MSANTPGHGPHRPERPINPNAPHNSPAPTISPKLAASFPTTTPPKYQTRRTTRRRTDDLYSRRVLIPILLTMGFLFCLIGAAQWTADADYPFSAANMLWSAIALPAIGAILLVLAIINMVYVKRKLAERP